MKRHRTNEEKTNLAQLAIAVRKDKGSMKELAFVLKVNYTVLNKWVREYQAGMFEKKFETPTLSPYIEQIQLLKSIDKSLIKIIDLLDNVPADLVSNITNEINQLGAMGEEP